MPSKFKLALLALICGALLVGARLLAAQDLSFQIPTTQAWTDTGLDLQAGDVLNVSAKAPSLDIAGADAAICDPKGTSGTSTTSGLPLPSAPAGALIARLHANGAAPVLIGSGTELRIDQASHLYLGVNMANSATCQGTFAVKVHVVSAASRAAAPAQDSSSGAAASTSTAQTQQSRGQQLKSQLSAAAQVFMSGQFGMGKSESGASSSNVVSENGTSGEASTPAPVLHISEAPLDSDLRKSIDSLPRRVNDQFQNQGDMVNFVIVGSQKDVQAALDAATWHVADTSNSRAVMNAIMETYESKDYLAMPMSTLYLFGRKQDFGYEMAEPIAMVASRHHFRIWKAPFTWKGSEVWVGAGTHDIGFAKDKRNNNVTHKIDPAVDGERDNIGSSLQKANKAKTLSYYLPPNPVQDAKNATGDGYHSDGRLLVVFLQ
ncbi:MAG TPA: LssY C-terminal domain-containing protein [Candidatus Solibacter sp.]|nr:LssY C-terminal domain-containing protein [Candidatus Solibacter sp.]